MCLDLVVFGIVTFLKQLIKISINGKPNLSLKELNTTIYAYKIVNKYLYFFKNYNICYGFKRKRLYQKDGLKSSAIYASANAGKSINSFPNRRKMAYV